MSASQAAELPGTEQKKEKQTMHCDELESQAAELPGTEPWMVAGAGKVVEA